MTKKERWELHVENWSECTLCSLKETRTNVIVGHGKLPCDVLVLGLTPSVDDDASDGPFYGRDGNWLRGRLEEVFPSPTYRVFMSNLLGCRVSDLRATAKKTLKKYLKCCKPRVDELIAVANPKVILCLGSNLKPWMERDKTEYTIPRKTAVVFASALMSITRSQPPHQDYLEAEFDLQLREIANLLEISRHAKDHEETG